MLTKISNLGPKLDILKIDQLYKLYSLDKILILYISKIIGKGLKVHAKGYLKYYTFSPYLHTWWWISRYGIEYKKGFLWRSTLSKPGGLSLLYHMWLVFVIQIPSISKQWCSLVPKMAVNRSVLLYLYFEFLCETNLDIYFTTTPII